MHASKTGLRLAIGLYVLWITALLTMSIVTSEQPRKLPPQEEARSK